MQSIIWKGGEMPVHGKAIVEVFVRGSSKSWTGQAATFSWQHEGGPADIVAYRVIDDKSEPQAHVPETPASALASQVGGNHYSKLKIQPVEYIHANKLPFIEGAIVKYITRWRDKDGIKDLEKIKHFVDLLIELEARA